MRYHSRSCECSLHSLVHDGKSVLHCFQTFVQAHGHEYRGSVIQLLHHFEQAVRLRREKRLSPSGSFTISHALSFLGGLADKSWRLHVCFAIQLRVW